MSGIKISFPIGSQGSLSFKSRATISVPPVVAPLAKTSPRPTPIRAPPQTLASMGSIGGKVYSAAMPSMARELTTMEKSDEASR